jgi:hypothetical protein
MAWPCLRIEKPRLSGAFLSLADDGLRTRDLRLGKPTLYQLSYVRVSPNDSVRLAGVRRPASAVSRGLNAPAGAG